MALRLGEGQDPQEFIENHGAEAFKKELALAPNALRFYCEEIFRKYPLEDRRTKKQAYVTIRDFFRDLDQVMLVGDDGVNEPELIHFLSNQFQVEESIIREQFFGTRSNRMIKPVLKSVQDSPAVTKGLTLMIWAIEQDDLRATLMDAFKDWDFRARKLAELYRLMKEHPQILGLAELLPLCSEELSSALTTLQWKAGEKSKRSEVEFQAILSDFQIQLVQGDLLEVIQEISLSEPGTEEYQRLEDQKLRLTSRRNELIARKSNVG